MTTARYITTQTYLDRILAQKLQDVARDAAAVPLAQVRAEAEARRADLRDFAAALHKPTVALIAEVKKASPSKGVLLENFDPLALARNYAANGASAISVLTDETFFQGHLDDLRAVRAAVPVPCLRKEFVIDPYQVYQARAAGADALLLIVMALADAQLRDFIQLIAELGMTALVEVHDEQELARALAAGARVVGVNNRNLKTFAVDLATTQRVARLCPPDVTLVAESGITTPADIAQMAAWGAAAVLVGETLVKSSHIDETVRAFSEVRR